MQIKVKKLDPRAIPPAYALPGDAGMDLFVYERASLKPGEFKAIGTGIAFEIPDGYVGLIWDKSGLSIKEGLKTLGGVLDSSYRGELKIGVINLSKKEYTYEAGHKIAQMLIQKVEAPTIELTADLGDTKRGSGGFGSTGK